MIGFGFSLTGQRRAASGGGAATLPAQANVTAWHKADAGTYQAFNSLTTPATANNDPVGTWGDQSGNSRNLYQYNEEPDWRPLLKTNVQNSKPVLRFDGVDDSVLNDASGIASDNTWAVLFCGAMTNTGVAVGCDAVNGGALLRRNGTNVDVRASTTTNAFGRAAFNDSNFHIWLIVYDGTATGNANRLRLYKDGSQVTLSFPSGSIGATSGASDFITLGGPISLEASMDAGELVVWNKVLSAQEITDAFTYANSRWAVY